MKNCFDRTPHTMKDWLLLAAGARRWFAAADWLPGVLRGRGVSRAAGTVWRGLLLAYVLDIPTRFFLRKRSLAAGAAGGDGRKLCAVFRCAGAAGGARRPAARAERDDLLPGGSARMRRPSAACWSGCKIRSASIRPRRNSLCRWWARHCKIGSAAVCPAVRRVRRRISSPARRGAAGNAVVALAASIYLLSGRGAAPRGPGVSARGAAARAAGSVLEICRLANKIFSGYIGGQLVDALLVGGETFALMSIFGLEYAPLLAVLVGVTNIVPVLGPFLGAVPGLIILLLELPLEGGRICHHYFCCPAGGRQLYCAAHSGRGHRRLPGLGVLLAIVVGGRGSASRAWCWACRRWPCWRRCSNRLSGPG